MSERPLAVITGASGGIGLELARCAAADGFDLVLVARRRDVLDAVAGEIQSRYRVSAAVIDEDLGEPGAAARLLAQIERPIEVLVNNAGFGIWESFAESDAAEIDAMVALNVAALTTLTRAVLPAMIERRSGGILNVASVAGFMPGPHAATYYATKNYVLALSEGIAQEVDQFGVTVSALCPGPVATGFQDRSGQGESLVKGPLVMQADEVARIGWKLFRGGRRVIVPGFGNKALTQLGWSISKAELMYRAKESVELDAAQRKDVEDFLNEIDDNDDVHRVYAGLK